MKENNKSSGFCWGLVAGMVLLLLIECVVEVGETMPLQLAVSQQKDGNRRINDLKGNTLQAGCG